MKLNEIAGKEMLVNPEPTHQKELIDTKQSFRKVQDEIISTLQKECSEVLKIYKKTNGTSSMTKPGKLMFRGERSDVVFFKNSIWAKRKPKYLGRLTHDASVDAFTNLGLIANRENSIFCARYNIAKNWGTAVYIIFPIDGYEVTWFDSPDVGKYMYDKLEMAAGDYVRELAIKKYPDYKWRYEGNSDEEYFKFKKIERDYTTYRDKLMDDLEDKKSQAYSEFKTYIEKIIKKYNPVSNNLEKALNTTSNNEFLVSGNAYYGLQLSWFLENNDGYFFKKLFEKV